jgi:hypothetical protein
VETMLSVIETCRQQCRGIFPSSLPLLKLISPTNPPRHWFPGRGGLGEGPGTLVPPPIALLTRPDVSHGAKPPPESHAKLGRPSECQPHQATILAKLEQGLSALDRTRPGAAAKGGLGRRSDAGLLRTPPPVDE